MNISLAPNSRVILALTAPFPGEDAAQVRRLLSAEEYGALAGELRGRGFRPSDLSGEHADEVMGSCSDLIDPERLRALMRRASRAEAAAAAWESEGVWFLTRADRRYPKNLKARLREDAPPVLWGLGSLEIAGSGGLAIAGKPESDPLAEEQGLRHGELAAYAGISVIATGRAGAEAAALRGALKKKGVVCQAPGKPLEAFLGNAAWQRLIDAGRLALVSPYAPDAPASAISEKTMEELAMALGDCALLVNADSEGDAAWQAAEELLGKYESARIAYWDSGAPTPAIEELIDMGMEAVPEFGGVVDLHAFVKGRPEAPREEVKPHEPGEFQEVPPEPAPKAAPAAAAALPEPEESAESPEAVEALKSLKATVREMLAMKGMRGEAILQAVASELIAGGRIDPVVGTIIMKVGYTGKAPQA